ncbi:MULTISPECIES: hypothetical protein [Mesorhizobium]|uniref:GAP1-N1 domain-containing protein n=1 Tax=Mesorhizobium TaxID=68287 RepID=UPI0010A96B5F|nr:MULTISPECIES: hypothetical protein [Mesorhizobium]
MNPTDYDRVDQALFGYSEGHRQIAASIRLPAADLYRLSAASDLATGTKLGPDESYITGVPLEESKRYALIRTWLAPELPRPGCVWSHVLLLDTRILGSRTNLQDLLQHFRRPQGDFKVYSSAATLRSKATEPVAIDEAELQQAIQDYYSGRPALLSATLDQKAAEGIVTAMWSQQWPRLRAAFAFRTARTERRKSDLVHYDVQLSSPSETEKPGGTSSDWALIAARDAATCHVTDLRRFLWRYGRDIAAARTSYRMLVELFLLGRGHQNIPTEHALRVFRSLADPDDGQILKRDILGIPAASPSLSPPISPIGLLEVLADENAHQIVPAGVVAQRFQDLDRVAIGAVAHFLDLHYDALAPWKNDLENAIVTGADASTLSHSFPQRFLMPVLRARPDLVNLDAATLLSNDQLTELLDIYPATSAEDALASEAVRRDLGAAKNSKLVRRDPERFFKAALNSGAHSEIASAWKSLWPSHAEAIFAAGWPRTERSWSRVALGIAYMEYPRRVGPRAEEWAIIFASLPDDLHGDDRVRLQGYLLRTALDEDSEGTWKLCATVLPELRPVILRGALPDDVYRMLSSDLPRFNTAGYWDINRRVLICLSYLRRKISDPDAEGKLGLSDHDRLILFDGAADEDDSKRPGFWWW